ncbi:hypothetical protein N9Y47_06785 [Flavobacteriaceae bacterium]|nr:hypothetical protein [Flavobacteriaceae bacterium]
MRNQQTNEGSVKQSSTPSTDGLLIRASFLGSYLSKQFDRIDKEGFKAENDVPVIEEFLNQMIRTWVDYMEENGIEIHYPYINDVSMKQSSTSSTEIKDRLFGELGDTSYGDFLEVKSAIEEGNFQKAWEEFGRERDYAESHYYTIEELLSDYEASI